jgi:hypothetical protein
VWSSFSAHLAVDKRDAILVSGQCTHRLGVILSQGTSIPYFTDCIISTREQDLGAYISKGHCIHIILMRLNLGEEEVKMLEISFQS